MTIMLIYDGTNYYAQTMVRVCIILTTKKQELWQTKKVPNGAGGGYPKPPKKR